MSTCPRTFRRMSKHPKIPERLHVTSKRPEISGCLDVRLNVLEFQDAIFTLPRTFRRSKVYGCRHGGRHRGAHGGWYEGGLEHKHHKRLSSSKFEMYTNTITVCNFLPFEIQIVWVGGSIINGISKRVVAWIGLIGLKWAGRSDALWWLFGGDLKIGFVWDEKTSPPIMA